MERHPLIYTACMDVEPAFIPTFKRWYASRHAPDLLAAGFYSAHAYYAQVGEPLVCDVYQIPGVEVLSSPSYRDIATKDPERAAVLARVHNVSYTVYEQIATIGLPEPGDWDRGERRGGIGQPCLTRLCFDAGSAADEPLRRWFREVLAPRLGSLPGFRGSRLCRQSGRHPAARETLPEWAIVSEWGNDRAAAREGAPADVVGWYRASSPAEIGQPLYSVARLEFGLVKP